MSCHIISILALLPPCINVYSHDSPYYSQFLIRKILKFILNIYSMLTCAEKTDILCLNNRHIILGTIHSYVLIIDMFLIPFFYKCMLLCFLS